MFRQSSTRLVRRVNFVRWTSQDIQEMRKLPPIPANLPTKISAPWLTENQLRLYLPPLIESGWTLGWNKELCTFYLRGNFPAKRCKRALNLMDAIRTVAMEENHHPDEFGWSAPYVFVNVLTHSATTNLFRNPATDTHPGLTIRDVRFALLLQDHYRQNFRQIVIPDAPISVGVEQHNAENTGLVKNYMKQAGLDWFEDDA